MYAVNGSRLCKRLPAAARASKPGVDGHAGEGETSNIMAHRPELAHPERASTQSGADQNRLELPEGVYTGIWWFAKYPNHYQGDAAGATAARGDAATRASRGEDRQRDARSSATRPAPNSRRSSSRRRPGRL